MNYFQDCLTVEQVKKAYRDWAFKLHPDCGGDLEEMKQLNLQYEKALKSCDGQTSTDSEGTTHTYHYNEQTEQEIINAIAKLLALKLESCDILLIGTWLWITGSTKPYKEQLKEIGCNWHSKRGCWYYRTENQKRWSHSKGSLADLASKYGVSKIEDLEKKPRKKQLAK